VSDHVAIFLPGAGYRHAHPLLWFARQALRQVGATEVLVEYEPVSSLEDLLEPAHPFFAGVREVVAGALAEHAPERVTLVGKSLGTIALGEIARSGLVPEADAVWLTPIWEHDPTFESARACAWRSLYAVGTSDPTFRPDRHHSLGGATVVVDGGDHALQIEHDVAASLAALTRVVSAVYELVSS
jgi:hypothetical protein